jgi:CubicO group peptidase (beta-lactamase class C family)
MPYSVTKPFVAVAALVLVDRGVLDLDADLTSCWPQLGVATTLRQLLSHGSGLALLERPAPPEAFYDWDLMIRLIEEQPALWPPGQGCGEAALIYGHLVGEVVRRVDGRTVGRVLREEVCGPHGLDFHLGLDDPQVARCADLTGYDEQAGGSAVTRAALGNPPGALDPAVVNSAAWRRAEVGAVNGHGTARAVAGLFAALQEGRVLSAPLLAEMTSVTSSGTDHVLGEQAAWGLGVRLDDDGYGMGGVGGSVGWCSTAGDYVLAFVTGRIAGHDRSDRLENALRSCLSLPPV